MKHNLLTKDAYKRVRSGLVEQRTHIDDALIGNRAARVFGVNSLYDQLIDDVDSDLRHAREKNRLAQALFEKEFGTTEEGK